MYVSTTVLKLDPMPVSDMGGGESRQAARPPQPRHSEVRQSGVMPNRLPMPDHSELERRFTKVLVRLSCNDGKCLNVIAITLKSPVDKE